MANPKLEKIRQELTLKKTLENGTVIILDDCEEYVFRFNNVVDPDLGRIGWSIEPVKESRKRDGIIYISGLMVWASQTNDSNLKGKLFLCPMFTQELWGREIIQGTSKDGYFSLCSKVSYCNTHKELIFVAYPEDRHNTLIVENRSSIFNRIYFDTQHDEIN